MTNRHPKRLQIGAQAMALRARRDGSVALKAGTLTWEGDINPTPLSATYRVRITQRPAGRPEVIVLDLPLRSRPGERIPHMFQQKTLCVHFPYEYDPSRMLLADTIVPWTSEWLLHYELWHATGEWHGGGHEPGDSGREPGTAQQES